MENDPVDPETIERARQLNIIDLEVGRQSLDDWYCVTRGARGDPALLLKLGVYNKDAAEFARDSLFCEYAYILNFDTKEIEFYKGFNHDPQAAGRYAKIDKPYVVGSSGNQYYGIALVGECPFGEIPDNWKDKFYPEE
jgi:hypothetical protein